MEIDFEKIYSISVNAMRLNRSHPEVPRDMKWALQFGVMHGVCTIVYCAMAYNIVLALKDGNYPEACKNGIASVIFFIVTFQYFILVLKQDTLVKIFEMMKHDFKKSLPYDEKMIVLEYANKGGNVCRQWLIITFTTGGIFPLKHIILEIYLYITGEFELLMPYPLTFPSPLEEVKFQPAIFTIIYIVLLYYMLYGSCAYVSFVPLGPSFMLHACGQLEIVKKRAAELFISNTEKEVKVKLIEIVKHLQYIYDFVDCIKDCFRVVYEITLKGSTVLLPVTLYEVVTAFKRGEFSVEFITFLCGGTLISSSPCYYSDMLMEKGEDVRHAIYCCGWEALYDHRARTTIMLVLQRALVPTSVRTMFRTVCLDALTDMFQQSYAIFNLMNAAWE